MTRQFAVLMFPFLPTFHVVDNKGVHTGIKFCRYGNYDKYTRGFEEKKTVFTSMF